MFRNNLTIIHSPLLFQILYSHYLLGLEFSTLAPKENCNFGTLDVAAHNPPEGGADGHAPLIYTRPPLVVLNGDVGT